MKEKLLKASVITFVTEAWAANKPKEADIEDLLDPTVYDDLVKHTYKAELAGKALTLNAKIPRIVKRYEEAFAAIGLEFNKTRPAREFMARMGTKSADVLPEASAERFTVLFKAITTKYVKAKG